MTGDSIPVAVVGLGNMGSNHARVYDSLPDAELVEVVEPDAEQARRVRDKYDVTVVDDVSELTEAKAASIAVPNGQHLVVAEACADLGIDFLMEKPLALTVEDAEQIVEFAAENDLVLQVGHIEQFNPAVKTLGQILETEDVIAIEAHRLGPFNEHLTTESVVFDLMIHDLDVVTALSSSNLEKTRAFGTSPRSDDVDHAIALMKFENDVLGTATASHITHGKIRRMNVTTRNAYVSLDYQQQDIVVQRRGVEQTEPLLNQSGYRTETVTESPYIQTREPLKIELEHFVECCRRRSRPRVSGREGVRAVEIATEVISQLDSN